MYDISNSSMFAKPWIVTNRIPEIRFPIFSQMFGIFDDFSKWNTPKAKSISP